MTTSAALPWELLDDRTPLSARMAARAAQRIVERHDDPGTLLRESDLATAEGASRTPAREAMLQLEAWGLVRLLPKKGALVTSVTRKERSDLIALRTLLEADAVRTVATAGPEALRRLAAGLAPVIERQRRALADPLAFAGADHALHALIIQAGGNDVVARLLRSLAPRLARLTYEVVTDDPGRLPTLLAEHAALAERASAGDAEGFASLVRSHVDAAYGDRGTAL